MLLSQWKWKKWRKKDGRYKEEIVSYKKKDIVFFNTVECFLNILIQWKYFYTCGWKVSTVDIFRISDIFRVFLKSENLGNCLNSFDFCKTFNITNNISKDAISPLELSPNKHLAHSRIKQISLSLEFPIIKSSMWTHSKKKAINIFLYYATAKYKITLFIRYLLMCANNNGLILVCWSAQIAVNSTESDYLCFIWAKLKHSIA